MLIQWGVPVNVPGNKILRMLPPDDWARIAPLFTRESLEQGQVLHEPLQPIVAARFFESGLSSEIATNMEGEKIEVGCIGNEGFSGLPLVLSLNSTAHRAFMQQGGTALTIGASDLSGAMDEVRNFRLLLLRFVHVFMIQVAATALADGRYEIHKRLARWLLMSQDRIQSDELRLTHDFLALMLGVRRSSVTDTLHILEGHGVIRAKRALIVVRDRAALEKIAGHCYGVPEAEYQRVMNLSV
jgi:CRP-like cAMP-binding protein